MPQRSLPALNRTYPCVPRPSTVRAGPCPKREREGGGSGERKGGRTEAREGGRRAGGHAGRENTRGRVHAWARVVATPDTSQTHQIQTRGVSQQDREGARARGRARVSRSKHLLAPHGPPGVLDGDVLLRPLQDRRLPHPVPDRRHPVVQRPRARAHHPVVDPPEIELQRSPRVDRDRDRPNRRKRVLE
eukprot:527484-Rhodomonas_salina.1